MDLLDQLYLIPDYLARKVSCYWDFIYELNNKDFGLRNESRSNDVSAGESAGGKERKIK